MHTRRSAASGRCRCAALAALLLLVGCAGDGGDGGEPSGSDGEPGTTAVEATAAPKGVLAKAASSAFAVEGRDIRLVRVSDRELALQLELFNGTDAAVRPADAGLDPLGRETLLADLPRRTVYGMLRAGGLNARITANESIPAGGTATVTSVFSAPPGETTEMLVMIGALEPVVVPVQPRGAPALRDDQVLTGEVPASPLVSPILSLLETGGGGLSNGPLELVLSGDVLFEFGLARLTPAAKAAVSLIAEQVDSRTSGTVTVAGHTDSVGDEPSNQTLSEQRAAAVRDVLKADLGGGFTYVATGAGETQPISPNQNPDGSDNPDGRATNRRVEVRVDAGQTGPTPLDPLALDDRLAGRGFKVQVDTIERIAGYLLVRAVVVNPTGGELEIDTGDGFIGQNHAPVGVTLVDTTNQERLRVGRWQDVSSTEHYAGSFSNAWGARRSGVVPSQAEVLFWGLYPAPASAVTSVDVEIGGFGQRVPGQVIAD